VIWLKSGGIAGGRLYIFRCENDLRTSHFLPLIPVNQLTGRLFFVADYDLCIQIVKLYPRRKDHIRLRHYIFPNLFRPLRPGYTDF